MGRLAGELALLPDVDRFWLGVVKRESGCWERVVGIGSKGYSWFWDSGLQRRVRAHRWIYEHINGPIPDGLHVLHGCDNPPCVRPAHLRAGTHTENMQDRSARGRGGHVSGTAHPNAKLSEAAVFAIRRLFVPRSTGPTSSAALAERFGTTPGHVRAIARGRAWRGV